MIDQRYFIRNAQFELVDEHVVVTDPTGPRIITLDPWLEVVFAAANGQRTVEEFIQQLAAEYPDGAPPALRADVIDFIQNLERAQIIKLLDQPRQLPYYFSGPTSELDLDQVTVLMREDGLIS